MKIREYTNLSQKHDFKLSFNFLEDTIGQFLEHCWIKFLCAYVFCSLFSLSFADVEGYNRDPLQEITKSDFLFNTGQRLSPRYPSVCREMCIYLKYLFQESQKSMSAFWALVSWWGDPTWLPQTNLIGFMGSIEANLQYIYYIYIHIYIYFLKHRDSNNL